MITEAELASVQEEKVVVIDEQGTEACACTTCSCQDEIPE